MIENLVQMPYAQGREVVMSYPPPHMSYVNHWLQGEYLIWKIESQALIGFPPTYIKSTLDNSRKFS